MTVRTPRRRGIQFALIAALTPLIVVGPACGRFRGIGGGSVRDTAFVGVAVGLQTPERYVDVYNGVQIALDELNAHRSAGTPVLALRRAPATARATVQIA